MPPIRNGILCMKASSKSVSHWSNMLYVIGNAGSVGRCHRQRFQYDRRRMTFSLDDGLDTLAEPLLDDVTKEVLPREHI